MPEHFYLALIGDIVNSKKLTTQYRREVQISLERILNEINELYKEHIVSQFLITLGDEFQGLLRPDAPIYEMIGKIMEDVNSNLNDNNIVEIRFGVGLGTVVTDIKNVAIGMDGPAFHFARQALTIGHSKKGHTIIFRAAPNTISEAEEKAISTILELLAITRKFWMTKLGNFSRMIPLLRRNSNQKEIAESFGCSQPLVSKQMAAAYWSEIKELEDTVQHLLPTFLEKLGRPKKNKYARTYNLYDYKTKI